ncbi:LCP family protein [Longispora albida]|uniref:LCP family glycopolymer transferase n=1 Tax=Longispora albida TaxID=203523 RepID=UPI000A059EBF|nr:LCP family protein [Longispora albida]
MTEPRPTGRASVPSGRAARPQQQPPADPWDDVAPAAPHRPSGRAAVGSGRPPVQPPRGTAYGKGAGKGPGKRRPRWGRIALVVSGVLVIALIAAGFGAWSYLSGLNDDVKRTDAFEGLVGNRPAKTVDGAFNILLLGSDSRNPDNIEADARADTMMLLHVTAKHDQAYVISLPRDLWVHVPKNPKGGPGNQMAKLNAAFAWGGAPLTVATVEGYTGVRVDHVALIDFDGLRAVTDALGGVDMYVEQDVTSIHGYTSHRSWKKGMNHFSGDAALDYIRQRKQFPDGDFARMRHQQQFIKAMLDKAADTGTLTNPVKLKAFLDSAIKALVVDKDFQLIDMAIQFRGLRSNNLTFMTSPNAGTDTVDGESVILSDKVKAKALYEAVNKDKIAEWVQANPPQK